MSYKSMVRIGLTMGLCSLFYCGQTFASSLWIGTSSDLNTASNWNPTGVPTSSDVIDFNSTLSVNKTPTATSDFSVDSINFLQSASAFSFSFTNCTLEVYGAGITGTNTNTTFSITNINNTDNLDTNLEFSNSSTSISSGAAVIYIRNSGALSGADSSVNMSEIGSSQLIVNNPFFMNSYGQITVDNIGVDNSTGSGNNTIASTSYQQVDFDDSINAGDYVTISISNSGTHTGTGSGCEVGTLEEGQLTVSGPFVAGNYLSFSVSNTGVDSSTGDGNNYTGYVSSEGLMDFSDTFTVGNYATISGTNSGTNTGTNSVSSTFVGYERGDSFYLSEIFQAGNSLTLTMTNVGVDSSTGVGGNRVGYTSGGQLNFGNTFTAGNHATVTCTNSGTNSGSNTSSGNEVGVLTTKQFILNQGLQADDYLTMTFTNSGSDSSSGFGGHSVGAIRGQIEIGGAIDLGDHATISCGNTGTRTGTNATDLVSVGYISGDQVDFGGVFNAGDYFTLSVTNTGDDQGSGANNNAVGYVDRTQVRFESACVLGDDASITMSNSGTSTATSIDYVGVIFGEQLLLNSDFTAGQNLTITATNNAAISGGSIEVGYISADQINFNGACTFGDGAAITAYNNGVGTVFGSQIHFSQGFSIVSGQATIQAVNEGTISGGYGIHVEAGVGGNVNVVLENSSLYVDTTETIFTIGALNGDSTSTVQVKPDFIISTGSGVSANFAGDIQDFPAMTSTLTKQGSGIQKLSGTNTFTGLTTVEEGTLVLTGSLAGALDVATNGVLKGTGSVAGNVNSTGTIAPGQSIGTIHFLGNFTNTNGEYDVEVNGAGLSDLISVSGDVTLDGGLVSVSSVDGTYRFQDRYTIVEAASVTGTYSGVIAASSLLQPIISYDAQHVYLLLLTDIQSIAKTHNQEVIAIELDGITSPTEEQTLLLSEMVDLSPEEAREALDSLSGFQHTTDLFTTQVINRQFIRRLYDPLRSIVTTEPSCCPTECDPCCCGIDTWLDIGGSFLHIANNSNARGVSSQGYNITGGVQKTFCQEWTFGIAGCYEQDFFHFKESTGSEHSSTWLVGLYGLYRPSCFYGLVDFVYGNSLNHLTRDIDVGTLSYSATSRPNTAQYTFYGEAGIDWNLDCVLVQPFFGLEVGNYRRNHVTESFADGWGLVVNKRNRTLATTRLGAHITANNLFDQLSISLDLAWNCLVSQTKNKAHERFQEFGSAFDIYGTKLNANSVDYALTFTTPLADNFTGYIEASGESWSNANLFNIIGGITFCW